jgi:hypothetical protein
MKERGHLEDINTDRWELLNRNQKQDGRRVWTGFIWLRIRT